ncbi:MAG: alpha/beta hydrolase [Bacteroidetes bacterium]|nr:alpha/beta hydrolase [Bacteroidota bacterium]
MKNIISLLSITLLMISQSTFAQEYKLPLYKGTPPGFKDNGGKEQVISEDIVRISHVQTPDIAVYLPSKKMATGQAVIICPGGGYHILAYDYEGSDVARYLNSIGVAGIVLKYRLPVYGNCEVPHKTPLMDAQRAMRLVRNNAANWNIDPGKIGIMGFSAGGHLASTLGTHFDYGNKSAADSVERMSCRPDFMILMYPVITFTDPSMHKGSREALLGKDPDPELVKYYSNELQVKTDTPPAILILADDDKAVPSENSILMYRALQAKGIPSELHIVSEGGHGYGLSTKNEHIGSWTNNVKLWLEWLNNQSIKK